MPHLLGEGTHGAFHDANQYIIRFGRTLAGTELTRVSLRERGWLIPRTRALSVPQVLLA